MNNLITKSLEEANIQLISAFPTVLLSKTEVGWLEWIAEYTMKYGQPPTVKRLVKESPSLLAPPTLDILNKDAVLFFLVDTKDLVGILRQSISIGYMFDFNPLTHSVAIRLMDAKDRQSFTLC